MAVVDDNLVGAAVERAFAAFASSVINRRASDRDTGFRRYVSCLPIGSGHCAEMAKSVSRSNRSIFDGIRNEGRRRVDGVFQRWAAQRGVALDDKALGQKIASANVDWGDRPQSERCVVQYNHDADILYVAYGEPVDGFSVSVGSAEDNTYLRVGADSFRIVGIELLDFRRTFVDRHAEIRHAIENLFAVLGPDDWKIEIASTTGEASDEENLFKPAARASLDYFSNYIPRVALELAPA